MQVVRVHGAFGGQGQGQCNRRVPSHQRNYRVSRCLGPRSAGPNDVEETRYEVKSSEDCLSLPKAVPAKSKPSKGNAASAMDFSQWNFPEHTHKLGRVKLMMALHHDEEANSIIPVKPMVYLTVPIKMKKGDFVLLG